MPSIVSVLHTPAGRMGFDVSCFPTSIPSFVNVFTFFAHCTYLLKYLITDESICEIDGRNDGAWRRFTGNLPKTIHFRRLALRICSMCRFKIRFYATFL